MNTLKEISVKDLKFTPFDLKNEWMLVTAEKDGKVNTLTASWGGLGIMWNKEVAFVVIRPQRYTKSFKKKLSYLGNTSGRDEDKIAKAELTIVHDNGIPYFEEAHTSIFVKKLFVQPITEDSFLDKGIIGHWYPAKDFHYLYIAEITKVLEKSI